MGCGDKKSPAWGNADWKTINLKRGKDGKDDADKK